MIRGITTSVGFTMRAVWFTFTFNAFYSYLSASIGSKFAAFHAG